VGVCTGDNEALTPTRVSLDIGSRVRHLVQRVPYVDSLVAFSGEDQ
jgi:hypothetical protein